MLSICAELGFAVQSVVPKWPVTIMRKSDVGGTSIHASSRPC